MKLPKLGWVRIRWSRALGGTVRSATVSRDGLGWHVAFGVYAEEPDEQPINTGPAAGVDVGIACSVFVSAETTERQRPDTLTAGERQRLKGLEQRKARQLAFAKKHNGGRYSNRLRKTIAQISAVKARQARRRADWNHKLTDDLAKNHGMIAVEDLKVSNMVRSARGTVEQPGRGVKQKAGLNRSIPSHGPAVAGCSPAHTVGTPNTPTAMPHTPSSIGHFAPPDGNTPCGVRRASARAVAREYRARAVPQRGKAIPQRVAGRVNQP
ncbi:RNA-guided endonuclease InsQ/TnpB family protein [Saccharopolyspora elongata]|uniref:RNA-guided endonuclease InsQ/TnpB family protein n=1 Tax=Saccharopolyspora elongata TaxID=2530387 RepID=UPI001F18041C|nr:transposase [Saccharopolyspora elongata]